MAAAGARTPQRPRRSRAGAARSRMPLRTGLPTRRSGSAAPARPRPPARAGLSRAHAPACAARRTHGGAEALRRLPRGAEAGSRRCTGRQDRGTLPRHPHRSRGPVPEPRPRPTHAPERPSIAVLPFSNLSGDADLDHLCDGITEDTITGLGRFRLLVRDRSLFVIGRVRADIRRRRNRAAARRRLSRAGQPAAAWRARAHHRAAHRRRQSGAAVGRSL